MGVDAGNGGGVGPLKQIDAGDLSVGYVDLGPRTGQAVLLLHGTLEGDSNGAPHLDAAAYRAKFDGTYVHRLISGGVGHNLPQEAPRAFADAVIEVDGY